jgi:hypothetical protein
MDPREQYGHVEVELKTSAIIEAGEDADVCASALLDMLRDAVSEKLGISVPVTKKDEPAKEPAKKKAGRPKKTDTTEAKKEDKPAKEADDVPGDDVPAEKDDDVPGDEVPDDNIKANPEDRVNPDDELPDDDEPEITTVDLSKMFTKAVKDKEISVKEVQELLAGLGVSKTSELKGDKITQARDQFEIIVAGV